MFVLSYDTTVVKGQSLGILRLEDAHGLVAQTPLLGRRESYLGS